MATDLPLSVRLDVSDLTLGDLDYLERLSGQEPASLMQTRAGRRLLALALSDLRTYPGSEDSGKRRSWSELTGLRAIDVYRSASPSEPDGAPRSPTD